LVSIDISYYVKDILKFESRACSVSAYIIFRIFDNDVSSPKSL